MRKLQLPWIVFTTIFCMSIFQISYAQSVDIRTPQTYDLGRYGSIPIGYYTGTPNISVPLYTLTDNGISVPIYLSYNASGMKPNKRSGEVGLNWSLSAGGLITRTVNGYPDDKHWDNFIYPPYLLAVSDPGYNLVESYIEYLDYVDPSSAQYWEYYDAPDIFQFNFLGHSGTFFCSYKDGRMVVQSDRKYKITYQVKGDVPNENNRSLIIEFTIIDDEGYTYVFGGDYSAIEYSSSDISLAQDVRDITITAWYLKEIISPVNKNVSFEYAEVTSPYINENVIFNAPNNYTFWNSHFNKTGTDWTLLYDAKYRSDNNDCIAVKTVYLNKIVSDNMEIDFHRTYKDELFYLESSSGCYQSATSQGKKINSIEVTNTLNNIREELLTIELDYTYLGIASKRLFLTKLKKSGEPPYEFFYHRTGEIPDPLTYLTDNWGFYSPNYNAVDYNTADPNIEGDANKNNPQLFKGDIGLLAEMTYPTGGSTSFEYEPHDYLNFLRPIPTTDIPAYLFRKSLTPGGARIANVIDRDGRGDIIEKEYKYVKDYSSTGDNGSSGILMTYPPYIVTVISGSEYVAKAPNLLQYTDIQDNHITYSEVTEIEKNNGYTTHKFTNYVSYPDRRYPLVGDFRVGSGVVYTNFTVSELYKYAQRSSRRHVRGKLNEVNVYNNDGEPVYKKTIDYIALEDEEVVDYTSYPYAIDEPIDSTLFAIFGEFVRLDDNISLVLIQNSYEIYYDAPKIGRIQEYTYENNGTILKTSELRYNPGNYRIALSKLFNSDGTINTTYYKYVTDDDYSQVSATCLPTETEAIYWLRQKNMITPVIEEYTVHEDGLDKKIISGKIKKYKKFTSNLIAPNEISYLNTTNSISLPGYNESYVDAGCNFVYQNAFYDTVQYFDRYDNLGNLLQEHKAEGVTASYIWSYNNSLPVAKIENATYNEIITGLTQAELDLINGETLTEEQLKTKLNTLRSSLPDAMVTSYTYKPFVGQKSVTNANNISTYFEYDENNRLEYSKNNDANILNKYTYHYEVLPLYFKNDNDIYYNVSALFTVKANNQNLTYYWDFGDGVTESTTQHSVYHAYLSVGTYTVTLTATDTYGYSESYSKMVEVSYPPDSKPEIEVSISCEDVQPDCPPGEMVKLIASGDAIDIGILDQLDVTIVNIGNRDLTISDITINSNEYSIGNHQNVILLPNEQLILGITSNGSYGIRTGIITINNDDDNENPFIITVNGDGGTPPTPVDISVQQGVTPISVGDTYYFVNTDIGASIDKEFNISNSGESTLYIENVTINSSEFSLINPPSNSYGPTSFTIRFNPASEGIKSAMVSINNNDPDENPFNFTVSGIGVGEPEIEVRQGTNDIPNINGSYNFGGVTLGSQLVQTFTIYNTGNGSLNLTDITTSNMDDFRVFDEGNDVVPGGSIDFTITFDPESLGSKSSTITIPNNDLDESPYTFTVTGSGLSNLTAGFSYSQVGITETVNFTDTSQGFHDSWHWDFGDGTTSNLQNPTHTFPSGSPDGEWLVTLTIYNSATNDSNSVSQLVSINL